MSSAESAPIFIHQVPRYWSLDAAKGIAILAVLCFHVLPPLNLESSSAHSSMLWISWLNYSGPIGVSLFFVLSGFSIHLSQSRKLAQESDQVSWGKFFCRRLWRLYPAYLAAIVFSTLLNIFWALVRKRSPWQYLPNNWDFVSHLLLIHTLTPKTFFSIIPALWFIGVQFHLYLLYPVFCWLIKRSNIHWALLIALICTLFFRLLSQSVVLPSTAHPNTEFALWMNAPQRWFEWCLGAWIAHQVVQGKPFPRYTWIFWLFIIWILVGTDVKVVSEPLLAITIGFVFWHCTIATQKFHTPPNILFYPLLYLGQISYSVYLLHQIFIPYIRSALQPVGFSDIWIFTILLGLVLVISVPLAALTYQWIEIPFSKLGSKLWQT